MKLVLENDDDPVTFLSNTLGQTDNTGQRDLWGHKLGHGDLYLPCDPVAFWSHEQGQTEQKSHRDL